MTPAGGKSSGGRCPGRVPVRPAPRPDFHRAMGSPEEDGAPGPGADPPPTRAELAAGAEALFAGLQNIGIGLHRATFAERMRAAPDARRPGKVWALCGQPLVAATMGMLGVQLPVRGGDLRLAGRAEAHWRALLAGELAAFRDRASGGINHRTGNAGGRHAAEGLQTAETLALLYALVLPAFMGHLVAGSLLDARRLLAHAADVVRAAGLPPEAFVGNPLPEDADGWLYMQHWLDAASNFMVADAGCAAVDRLPLTVDWPREFPGLRLRAPLVRVAMLPPPAPGDPAPEELAKLLDGISFGEAWGWLDPDSAFSPPEPGDERHAHVLRETVGNPGRNGFFAISMMVLFLELHWNRFEAYLGDAGLDVVDLVVADDSERRNGADGPNGAESSAHLSPDDAARLDDALHNPRFPEADRRWRYLRSAAAQVEAALPPPLRAAEAQGWDVDACLALAPPGFPPMFALFLLGVAAAIKRISMLLISPPPFAELLGPNRTSALSRGSSGSDDLSSDSDRTPSVERRLTLWLSTSAFASASRTAASLAALARMVVGQFRPQLAGQSYTAGLDRAAAFAAWFSVMVLRRFPSAFAGAPESAYPAAAALHSALHADARACLELLRTADRAEHEPVRVLLGALLDGEELRLSRRDVQMLALAKRAVGGKCRHGVRVGGGECWACAARDARRRGAGERGGRGSEVHPVGDDGNETASSSEGEPEALEDGPYRLPSLPEPDRPPPPRPAPAVPRGILRPPSSPPSHSSRSTSSGPRAPEKRVRFRPAVLVGTTHAPEDYPARSARAPFEPGLEVGWAPMAGGLKLAEMLEQRGGGGS
ncbi:hypothetical protein DFJ74DRAFT_750034 [Hyaloraphidium curvatum]|nr:hypothetical protein DFJ74DRAFT_750034 [Hyaloraphidium curvatum]